MLRTRLMGDANITHSFIHLKIARALRTNAQVICAPYEKRHCLLVFHNANMSTQSKTLTEFSRILFGKTVKFGRPVVNNLPYSEPSGKSVRPIFRSGKRLH